MLAAVKALHVTRALPSYSDKDEFCKNPLGDIPVMQRCCRMLKGCGKNHNSVDKVPEK
jgi:hypothetical protein